MISSRADLKTNTLYINIIGIINKDHIAEALKDVVEKCSTLREGYFVINDLSLYKCTSEKELDVLCNVSVQINKAKTVNKVVRILTKDSKLKSLFIKKDTQYNLTNIFYATSKKEASMMMLKLT